MVVHPGVIAAIFAGAVVAIAGKIIYDEYFSEYKSYEQFQSYEREFNRFHRNNNDFDFDDDREEEEKVYNEIRGEQSDIRKRKPFNRSTSNQNENIDRSYNNNHDQDQYELNELETSIAERKRRLIAEQAFLDQEEENLRNRKNALMNSTFDDVTPTKTKSHSSSSDEYDDEYNLRTHMAVFDPFADQFQDAQDNSINSLSNSDSTERMIIVDDNNRHSIQQEDNLINSTEFRYPSPHHNSPPTSNPTSVTDEERPVTNNSDSEESWDAVSELEEWNHSSTYSSDNEHNSHQSIISESDDDRLQF